MDSATNYEGMSYGSMSYELPSSNSTDGDLDQWAERISSRSSTREKRLQNRPGKKRRRPLRRGRKPSQPNTHIGLRSNNRLVRIRRKAATDKSATDTEEK